MSGAWGAARSRATLKEPGRLRASQSPAGQLLPTPRVSQSAPASTTQHSRGTNGSVAELHAGALLSALSTSTSPREKRSASRVSPGLLTRTTLSPKRLAARERTMG